MYVFVYVPKKYMYIYIYMYIYMLIPIQITGDIDWSKKIFRYTTDLQKDGR